ncbi:PIN domain containing protein, putative [Trypanosoma equiperdum]|uniref:PIN domain-containing protein n=2 Tax=Trypanozoon TaxID=39700 RepID=Q386H4_TRYB2|nr:hypothetical protein Tb11.02.0865 [Trypanosoma brucei brucei TREU927]EAN79307.1 hypothetical protein Tb11.02.0865 [Trypanosoma brucei brucei TREU927]SCU69487.1 PIN domain containing protein, putative [Trypanosoma equiperdum]
MLNITRLRNLPEDLFEVDRRQKNGSNQSGKGWPQHKELIFDFTSLVRAYNQNKFEHLTDTFNNNRILISELVLHQLDEKNKVVRSTDAANAQEDDFHPVRLRDLINFLVTNMTESWLEFQRKGTQEDKQFTQLRCLNENVETPLRLISYALYKKRQGKDVLLVTSDSGLKCEAGLNSIDSQSIENIG